MDIPYYIIYQGSLFHNMNVYHDIDKNNEIIRSNNVDFYRSYVMGSL